MPASPSRPMQRHRRSRTRSSAATVAILLLLGTAACTSTKADRSPGAQARSHQGPSRRQPPTSGAPREPAFSVPAAEIQTLAGPSPMPESVRAGVVATLDRYLSDGVVAPLRTGTPVGDLSALFTPAAAERLSGADRASLLDEGLAPAVGPVASGAADASLTGLAGPDGVVDLVAARIDVRMRVRGAGGAIEVVRQGELLLVPDGATWRIDGYDVRVSRDSDETTTTSVTP